MGDPHRRRPRRPRASDPRPTTAAAGRRRPGAQQRRCRRGQPGAGRDVQQDDTAGTTQTRWWDQEIGLTRQPARPGEGEPDQLVARPVRPARPRQSPTTRTTATSSSHSARFGVPGRPAGPARPAATGSRLAGSPTREVSQSACGPELPDVPRRQRGGRPVATATSGGHPAARHRRVRAGTPRRPRRQLERRGQADADPGPAAAAPQRHQVDQDQRGEEEVDLAEPIVSRTGSHAATTTGSASADGEPRRPAGPAGHR